MRSLLADVLEDQLSINATLPRTVRALLLRPGHLTNEYVSGRIASYVAPFRLYLAASLVFFLTLSLVTHVRRSRSLESIGAEIAAAADSLRAEAASESLAAAAGRAGRSRRFGIWIAPEALASDFHGDWTREVMIDTGIPRLDSLFLVRVRRMRGLTPAQAGRQLLAGLLQRAPTAMFVLLPVFALLLTLFYFRAHRYYVEHFVFALHLHAFAFLLFTANLFAGPFLRVLLLFWLLLYLPLALHRVYGQRWWLTALKTGGLSLIYPALLAIALVGTIVAGVVLA